MSFCLVHINYRKQNTTQIRFGRLFLPLWPPLPFFSLTSFPGFFFLSLSPPPPPPPLFSLSLSYWIKYYFSLFWMRARKYGRFCVFAQNCLLNCFVPFFGERFCFSGNMVYSEKFNLSLNGSNEIKRVWIGGNDLDLNFFFGLSLTNCFPPPPISKKKFLKKIFCNDTGIHQIFFLSRQVTETITIICSTII